MEGDLKQFNLMHPHPSDVGVKSLFRYSKSTLCEERLRDLFVAGRLYHPRPGQLNDPFECKPNFRWPKSAKDVQKIRKHLIKLVKESGKSRKSAEDIVAKKMAQEGFVENNIYEAVHTGLSSSARICSFTCSKDNLLFWAHYADSHRGFCLEYDATLLPISYAFKVEYSMEYPEAIYPVPNDARGLKLILVKSCEWSYEEEFRTIFVPETPDQPKNDGTSLVLSGNEIKNVYFGALMDKDKKELLLRILDEGLFNPSVWQAELSRDKFELDFKYVRCV